MLRLTESNRLEALADRLVAALDVRSDAPLVAETVVVPNFGMARWLSLAIARAHGVCANVRFVLPAKFVWEVLGGVVGPRAEVDVFDPTVLGWRVFDVGRSSWPVVRDAQGLRPRAVRSSALRAARRIVGVFDQYPVYRPTGSAAGSGKTRTGRPSSGVVCGGAPRRCAPSRRAAAALERGSRATLPPRARLGVPAMPPAYVAVPAAAATMTSIVPVGRASAYTRAQTPRELARRRGRRRGAPLRSNPLAWLGRQGASSARHGRVEPAPGRRVFCRTATILGAAGRRHAIEHRGSATHPRPRAPTTAASRCMRATARCAMSRS
jgi:exodeoxyribonuclease V gamma subunit